MFANALLARSTELAGVLGLAQQAQDGLGTTLDVIDEVAADAAVAVPMWVLVRELHPRMAPGQLASGDWHGYEMLFGYALAVVAGFLIGPISRLAVAGFTGIWLLARIAALVAPFGVGHTMGSALFALSVAALAAPKLSRGPSKLRNRVLGPLVLALCADGAITPFLPQMRSRLLVVGIDLYALLLALMGGRLIAAAAAGSYRRRGKNLGACVQPRIEGTLLAALLLLTACDLRAAPEAVCSAIAVLASLLLLTRWLRWRLWTCLDSWNLAALGVGCLWLPLGLAIRAMRSLPVWVLPSDALHGLTVGALGSPTLLVMGRTRAMTRRIDPERSLRLALASLLVSLAAGLRLAAGVSGLPTRPALLVGASTTWAAGFAITVWFLMRLECSAARVEDSARNRHAPHDP